MFSNSLAPVLSAYKASIRQNSAEGAVSLSEKLISSESTMIAVSLQLPHMLYG
jgi:hypothetical protein